MKWSCAIFLLALLAFLYPEALIAYSPTTTHAGLSQEIVAFYNEHYGRRLTADEGNLIIAGSVEEDTPGYRALNHFFDPIRNIGFNNGHTAKEWAFSPILQKHDILAAGKDASWPRALELYAQGDERGAFFALGHVVHLLEDISVPDHTRNDPHGGDAVTHESPFEAWTNLNKNKTTMRGIGLALYGKGERPIQLSTGPAFFDFLANYSNRNFFSQDTIKDGTFDYVEPKIVKVENRYAYGLDSITKDSFKLAKIVEKEDLVLILTISTDDDSVVLEEYFDRLSTQAIRAGAGLIDRFLTEAEAARAEYEAAERERAAAELARAQAEEARRQAGIFARIGLAIERGLFRPVARGAGRVFSGISTGVSITYYRTTQNVHNVARVLGFTGKVVAVQADKDVAESIRNVSPTTSATGPAFFVIASNRDRVDSSPSPRSIEIVSVPPVTGSLALIQELDLSAVLAAMESKAVTELEQNFPEPQETLHPPDLGLDPLLEAGEESPHDPASATEANPSSTTVPPSFPSLLSPFPISGSAGFGGGSVVVILIEDKEESAQAAPEPESEPEDEMPAEDVVEGEELEEDPEPEPDTTLPDITLSLPLCDHSLSAGECLLPQTSATASWATGAEDIDHFLVDVFDGIATTTTKTSELSQTFALADGTAYQLEVGVYDTSGNTATSTMIGFRVVTRPLIINEIAWAGTATSPLDEWIELLNISDTALVLDDMKLEAVDGTPAIELSGTLPAGGFFLLERRDDETISTLVADQIYGTGAPEWALSNDGEELRLVHMSGETETLLDTTPSVAICGGWCAGVNITEEAGVFRFSMQRTEEGQSDGAVASSWETYDEEFGDHVDRGDLDVLGTPKAENLQDSELPALE